MEARRKGRKTDAGTGGGWGSPGHGRESARHFMCGETLLKKNLEILKDTAERAGCRILLAQKAFSMYSVYPLIRQYLSGTAASGLYEARLGKNRSLVGRPMCFLPPTARMSLMRF